MNFTDAEVEQKIAEILSEMRLNPKVPIEDEARRIREEVFEGYKRFLFMNFAISAEAYERKHC